MDDVTTDDLDREITRLQSEVAGMMDVVHGWTEALQSSADRDYAMRIISRFIPEVEKARAEIKRLEASRPAKSD